MVINSVQGNDRRRCSDVGLYTDDEMEKMEKSNETTEAKMWKTKAETIDKYSIWRNKLIHSRVKSIFFLMIQTGIRQTEIINLNKSNYSKGMLKINEGKLTRRVALNGNTKRLLDEYLEIRFDNNESLFVNQDFKRITKSTVENGWKRISSAINLHFSSMDLRKTSAVLFAKSGSTVDELKNLYGFRTLQIASKYYKEGVERRSLEKQKEFDPISEIN